MSFSPLPEFLQQRLHQLASDPWPIVYDLGCGEGLLGQLTAPYGVKPFGLDNRHPSLGSAALVVGDVASPPFLQGKADLVLAGNLVRHLVVKDPEASFLDPWYGLLKPGGWLIVLEDEPGGDSPAQQNYSALQDFLVTLTEGRRGPLLGLGQFRKLVGSGPGSRSWKYGLQTNRYSADPEAVVRMLWGQGLQRPEGVAGRLIESIGKDGLAYGKYWWARWERC